MFPDRLASRTEPSSCLRSWGTGSSFRGTWTDRKVKFPQISTASVAVKVLTDPVPAGRIVSLSWHPSGSQIAAGMMDVIRVFDTQTGKQQQQQPDVPTRLGFIQEVL